MSTYMGMGKTRSPKPPNHLPSGWLAPVASAGSCHRTFVDGIKERKARYPFDRVSAYKVLESWDNLQHECRVLASVADYLRSPPCYGRASILVGCVEDDKAHRLKAVPATIARELGYNLIPAIDALHFEGVPSVAVNAFIRSIKPQVNQILADCDAIQATNSRSIKLEYAALKAGQSALAATCADALYVAEQAVNFCKKHGVL